ncbi:unnamed protein product, partial [Effrenium voratum]
AMRLWKRKPKPTGSGAKEGRRGARTKVCRPCCCAPRTKQRPCNLPPAETLRRSRWRLRLSTELCGRPQMRGRRSCWSTSPTLSRRRRWRPFWRTSR